MRRWDDRSAGSIRLGHRVARCSSSASSPVASLVRSGCGCGGAGGEGGEDGLIPLGAGCRTRGRRATGDGTGVDNCPWPPECGRVLSAVSLAYTLTAETPPTNGALQVQRPGRPLIRQRGERNELLSLSMAFRAVLQRVRLLFTPQRVMCGGRYGQSLIDA